jgi:hypothetical protein
MEIISLILKPFLIKEGAAFLKDVFLEKDSKLAIKMRAAIVAAIDKFHKKYHDQFGELNNNFLASEQNFQSFLKQINTTNPLFEPDDILDLSLNEKVVVPKEIVIEFQDILLGEICKDTDLNILFTIKNSGRSIISKIDNDTEKILTAITSKTNESNEKTLDLIKKLFQQMEDRGSITINKISDQTSLIQETIPINDEIIVKMGEEILVKIDSLVNQNEFEPASKIIEGIIATINFEKMGEEFRNNLFATSGIIYVKSGDRNNAELILEQLNKINFSNKRRWNYVFQYATLVQDRLLANKALDELVKFGLTNEERIVKQSTLDLVIGDLDAIINSLGEN